VATASVIEDGEDCNKQMPKGGWQEFSSNESLQRPAQTSAATPKPQQMVRVQPTRGGKGGKTVTVIRGLELDVAGMKALLKKLKTKIGSGGSAKDGVIELHGDQVDLALSLLSDEGYRPKRAGG
jgi:translation initiation factor 1